MVIGLREPHCWLDPIRTPLDVPTVSALDGPIRTPFDGPIGTPLNCPGHLGIPGGERPPDQDPGLESEHPGHELEVK